MISERVETMSNLQDFPPRQRRVWPPLVATVLAFTAAMFAARPVAAHARVEIGPYTVIVGWDLEPPIVGERNSLVIEITEDGNPVEGLEATLNAELGYGGRTFRANLSPSPTAGLYTAEIFPTIRGQYTVRLFGAIGDLEVDELVEPEEVFPAGRIQFPEALPDTREFQQDTEASIAELESQLQTARSFAYLGVGIGLLAIVLAGASLARQRR
jgi:hypothetical protein